jgi:hypothetical protein
VIEHGNLDHRRRIGRLFRPMQLEAADSPELEQRGQSDHADHFHDFGTESNLDDIRYQRKRGNECTRRFDHCKF